MMTLTHFLRLCEGSIVSFELPGGRVTTCKIQNGIPEMLHVSDIVDENTLDEDLP